MSQTGWIILFTGITAAATALAAWAAVYPICRNWQPPKLAYAFGVDLRVVHVADSPFGVHTEAPETKRFVLRISNPRLTPLIVQSVYFQAKASGRGDRYLIHYGGGLEVAPDDSKYLYLKMEPDLVPERSRVFLVVEALGWTKRIADLKEKDGDLGLQPIPDV